MTSQRVLSGSRTKGSTATITGSVQYFHQGTSVRTFSSYVGSTLPRIGSADRTEVYKDGSPLSNLNHFDDSVVINNDLADMGGESDGGRIEERVNHAYEKRVFGQAPSTLMGEPFADTSDFDPVSYIKDPGDVMWPVNMWNAGSLDKHEFDGVVEPLDIRRELFGEIDTRYEGRAVRGALVGAASERPWGSKELQNKWYIYDRQDHPFLDAPMSYNLMSNDKPAVVNYSAFTWNAFDDFYNRDFIVRGDFENLQTWSSSSIKLWASVDETNTVDTSSENVATLESVGFIDAGNVTIGSKEYPALRFDSDTPVPSRIDLTTTGGSSPWLNRFLVEERPSENYNFYEVTLSCWIKINPSSTANEFILWSFGREAIRVRYHRPFSDYYVVSGDFPPPRPTNAVRTDGLLEVQIRDRNSNLYDYIVTEDWNLLDDGEMHNVVVTARLSSWDSGVDGGSWPASYEWASDVSIYIDGDQVNTDYLASNSTVYDGYSSSLLSRIEPDFSGYSSYFGATRTSSTTPGVSGLDATFTLPAVWGKALSSSQVQTMYSAVRGDITLDSQVFTSESYNIEYGPSLGRLPLQAYQNIEQSSDPAFLEEDTYHDRVYFSLLAHNNSDMRVALQNLNSSSCESLTDPFEKRAASGLTTGQSVGSIAFSDTFIIGDKNEGQ